MGLHAVILVVVPTFIVLCVWQLHRALSGNDLSWAYVFEWPFFAGYAIYMWWRFVHEESEESAPSGVGTVGPSSASAVGDEDVAPSVGDAAELAAYNDYLAELAERGKPKRW
jgi:hypothetical protein